MNTLHLYAQAYWHAPAHIVGTLEALWLLHRAIAEALEHGRGTTRSFTADGEGYAITVQAQTDDQMDRVPLPYTDPDAQSGGHDEP